MVDRSPKAFYITLFKKDGIFNGYVVSNDPPSLGNEAEPESPQEPTPATPPTVDEELGFSKVFDTFVSSMESYRRFVTLTLEMGPMLSSAIASKRIEDFVKAKGSECSDLSGETRTVFELDNSCFREFQVYNEEIHAVIDGAIHLPEVAIIGLVSTYDAFLGRLLHVVLNMHPEIVLTSQKEITFAELLQFGSIEEARSALIDREIEAVIRSSHQDQFSWMEARFSISLRKDLSVWPRFIELCERRNLLTHTGGVVSAQYLANCKAHKVDLSDVSVGTKLPVDSDYFSGAVGIIYEIGVKLCHVFWRKFAEKEREQADNALAELSYNLIYAQAYSIAKALLLFGTTIIKRHSSYGVRRRMIVNLANAVRLQGRKEEARRILENEDWTAVDNNFKICVAAVNENVEEVVELMPKIGAKATPNAEDYRSWPVFLGVGSDQRFIAAFEEVFGEPFVATTAMEIDQPETGSAHLEGSDKATSREILH